MLSKLAEIRAKLLEGKEATPQVNYLLIFFFAGHGLLKDGGQAVLYNEFNSRTKYFRTLKIEDVLRDWAFKFPNSYVIGIFACCR